MNDTEACIYPGDAVVLNDPNATKAAKDAIMARRSECMAVRGQQRQQHLLVGALACAAAFAAGWHYGRRRR